jgi:hypothetical protein
MQCGLDDFGGPFIEGENSALAGEGVGYSFFRDEIRVFF